MTEPISLLTRLADLSGAIGATFSTMGCAMCFPAMASLGSAIGLGFLTQWEGLFLNTLIPVFASIALLANALGWFSHRQLRRSLLGITGPAIVLLSMYPWFQYYWSTWSLYGGLALMMIVAIWDMVSPANRHCDTAACKIPEDTR